jgi:hypothetical protein
MPVESGDAVAVVSERVNAPFLCSATQQHQKCGLPTLPVQQFKNRFGLPGNAGRLQALLV